MYVTEFEKTLHACTKIKIHLLLIIIATPKHCPNTVTKPLAFCQPCQVMKDQNKPCKAIEGIKSIFVTEFWKTYYLHASEIIRISNFPAL